MSFPLQKTFLSLNKYNFNAYNDVACEIFVDIKDYDNNVVPNQSVDIYLDDALLGTIKTDSNGFGTLSYTFSNRNQIGIHSIRANDASVALRVYFDSSWQPVTYSSTLYKDHSTATPVEYRVYNNIVEIRGAATNNSQRNLSNESFASIPSQYTPTTPVRSIQQGSVAYKFGIGLSASGNIGWNRYGTNSNVTSLPANSWLNVYLIYTI